MAEESSDLTELSDAPGVAEHAASSKPPAKRRKRAVDVKAAVELDEMLIDDTKVSILTADVLSP